MKALFITNQDIKRFSILDGNVDPDKFIQYIDIAQDIHIQNYLGTDLYVKLQNDIINDTLAGNYLSLVNTYIKPMLVHWATVEYLPFAAYAVSNKGVLKGTAENSESVSKNEVDYLVEQERNIAQHYTRRFIDFMSFNQSDFPEYNSNSNGDVYPDSDANFSGWVI
jgi:hypothetical protein